jgi:hypothetical protein
MPADQKIFGKATRNAGGRGTLAVWIGVAGISFAVIANIQYAPSKILYHERIIFDPRCEAWDNSAVDALAGLLKDRSEEAMVRARRGLYLLQRARSNCRFQDVAVARYHYDSITNLASGNGR